MNWMVQYTDVATSAEAARGVLNFLGTQMDFVAGRVMEPSAGKPGWRVQALMLDCGHDLPLPDGCRRVLVPASLLVAMEVRS